MKKVLSLAQNLGRVQAQVVAAAVKSTSLPQNQLDLNSSIPNLNLQLVDIASLGPIKVKSRGSFDDLNVNCFAEMKTDPTIIS